MHVELRTAGNPLQLLPAQNHVLWLILREGLLICSVGVLLSLPLAFGATRLLASQLYGLKPGDPISIIAAIFGILTVTAASCLIPARRAANSGPIVALRNE